MNFQVSLKDISDTYVYSLPNEDYFVSALNIEFEVEYEVRSYGIKGTSVIVTKCAIDLMETETDIEKTCEGYTLEFEQPTNYESIYIDDVEVDMREKLITVKFQ